MMPSGGGSYYPEYTSSYSSSNNNSNNAPQQYPRHNNNISRIAEHPHGPRSKCDQVIFEAMAKACEIIVTSRCLSSSSSAAPPTSRFNLELPELPSVRSILQVCKAGGATLQVPLCLDVYCTKPDDSRILLERWCLHYRPCSMERFLQREGTVTQDSIAQLRLVCKRIVLWLRTLCCWTSMLPATHWIHSNTQNGASRNMGFALYMVNDVDTDWMDWMQQQNFAVQQQPSSVVTPYGELSWKVLYAPQPKKLLQPHVTASIPIQLSHNHYEAEEADVSKKSNQIHDNTTNNIVPQSAPEYLAVLQDGGLPYNYQPSRFGTTYDPSRLQQTQQQDPSMQQHPAHGMLQRRHTVLGSPTHATTSTTSASSGELKSPLSSTALPPGRVMSGLSLALMTSDDGKPNDKRRAALHQMPPHLLDQQQQQTSNNTKAEYGYAYNNHIPWQAIHPSNTNPTCFDRAPSDVSETNVSGSPYQHRSQLYGQLPPPPPPSSSPRSPAPLSMAATPPGEAFLGTTPASTPFLIPPRNLMSTPPFQPRPMTFVPAAQLPDPISLGGNATVAAESPQQDPYNYTHVIPPLTSLDLLHSSPFQQQSHHPQQSMLSSLSMHQATTPNTAAHSTMMMMLSDARNTSNNSMLVSTFLTQPNTDYLSEDMPFAVDVGGGGDAASNAANLDGPSAAVTSFAHQLNQQQATRLQLFGSKIQPTEPSSNQQGDDNVMNSLADQLADFRSFGASLSLPAAASTTEHKGEAGVGGGSTSTLITTRS